MIGQLVGTIHQSWKAFSKRQQNVIVFGVFLVLGLAVWQSFPGSVYAAPGDPPAGGAAPTTPAAGAPTTGAAAASGADNASTVADWFVGTISKILLGLARLCISLTIFVLTFIIEVAGYNGFLDASAVSVGWVMVRDITNMGFVVVLLIIAFGTILGIEKYEWKKMLVKMVMAAILVNFSRTICGVIIDVAQVVMITFVNGVAATAGGNLIRMFNLDSIRDLSSSQDPKTFTNINFFVASVGALVFSAMALAMMVAFLVMLLARMIVLWVLIVLSPLAFVLSVLPQTEGYADKWWSEFGSNVVTGPALMFFVWLSFVTVGNGKINDEIAGASVTGKASGTEAGTVMTGDKASSGISAAWDWNNMANFAIAIGMLMVGAKVASELGGVGGEWAGQAVDFGKKVGYYASGAAAAKYGAGVTVDAVKKHGPGLALATAKMIPGVGAATRLATKASGFAQEQFYRVQKKRNDLAKEAGDQNKAIRQHDIDYKDQKKGADGKPIYDKDTAEGRKAYEEKRKELVAEAGGKGGRLWGAVKESFWETGDRAQKKAQDYVEAAEAKKDAYMGDFSTSTYGGGRRKYLNDVEAEKVKERGLSKKEEKKAQIRIGMLAETNKKATDLGVREHALEKKMEDLKEEKKNATAANDTGSLERIEKEMVEAKETKKALKKERKGMGEDLLYSTITSKEREHAAAAMESAGERAVQAGYAHTKTGAEVHGKAALAEMTDKTFKLSIDTHQAELQLDLLKGKVGEKLSAAEMKEKTAKMGVETQTSKLQSQLLTGGGTVGADFITSRAKYDAQTGAQQAAQKERLSEERRQRADDAQKIIKSISKSDLPPAEKDFKIKEITTTNGEVASAFYTALSQQNESLENQSRGLLNEDVMQTVIADRQHITLPKAAATAGTQAIEKQLTGANKEALLTAKKNRAELIGNKRDAAARGEIVYSEKDQAIDDQWERAILNKLKKISNIDDVVGHSDRNIVAGSTSSVDESYGIARTQLQGTLKSLGNLRINGTSNFSGLVQNLRGVVNAKERQNEIAKVMSLWKDNLTAAEQQEFDVDTVKKYLAGIVEEIDSNPRVATFVNEVG